MPIEKLSASVTAGTAHATRRRRGKRAGNPVAAWRIPTTKKSLWNRNLRRISQMTIIWNSVAKPTGIVFVTWRARVTRSGNGISRRTLSPSWNRRVYHLNRGFKLRACTRRSLFEIGAEQIFPLCGVRWREGNECVIGNTNRSLIEQSSTSAWDFEADNYIWRTDRNTS